MNVKDGVILPPILRLYQVAERVYKQHGAECTITSGMDGKHKVHSLHYKGLALDFRTRDLQPGAAQNICADMQTALGDDYDVIVESTHIHAEYDPK